LSATKVEKADGEDPTIEIEDVELAGAKKVPKPLLDEQDILKMSRDAILETRVKSAKCF